MAGHINFTKYSCAKLGGPKFVITCPCMLDLSLSPSIRDRLVRDRGMSAGILWVIAIWKAEKRKCGAAAQRDSSAAAAAAAAAWFIYLVCNLCPLHIALRSSGKNYGGEAVRNYSCRDFITCAALWANLKQNGCVQRQRTWPCWWTLATANRKKIPLPATIQSRTRSSISRKYTHSAPTHTSPNLHTFSLARWLSPLHLLECT